MKKLLTLLAVLCGAVGGWHACAAVGDEFRGVPVYPSDASDQLWYKVLSEPDENRNTGTVCVIQYPTGDNSSNYLGSSYEIPEMVERADGTSETVYVVVEISDAAFVVSENLTHVIIPSSVTNIGWKAFSHCSNLTSVSLSNGLTTIESSAFNYCTSLTNITLPDSVTFVGDSLFEGCTKLTTVTLPNNITSIGKKMFLDCVSLANITIPGSVTSIGDSAFENCTSLVDITIPGSVTSFGNEVFEYCTSLTDITLPNSVTSLGGSLFYGCIRLEHVTLPNSLTSIETGTFFNCISLESIVIPNAVASIGDSAFSGCRSLTTIAVPSNVTSIGERAFQNCSKLTSVTIYVDDEKPTVGTDAFLESTTILYKLATPVITVDESSQTITWTAGSSRADRYDIILYSVDGGQLYNAMEVYDRSFNYANWLTTTGKYYCTVRARDWIVATGETPCEPSEYAQSETFLSVRFDANGVAVLPVKSTEVDATLLTLNKMTRTIDVPQSDGEVIAVPLKVGLIVGGTALAPTYTAHLQFATDMSAEQRAAVTPQVTDFRVTAEGAQVVVGESVAGLWYGSAAGATVAAVQAAGVANVAAPFVAGTGGELSFETRPTTDTQRFFKILVSPYNPGYED